MRRWNGWGDDTIDYELPASAAIFLENLVGAGNPSPDFTPDQLIAKIPVSRLPDYPLIKVDALDRLYHARGQSLPDWVALRSGEVDSFPDGVAYPTDPSQVNELLHFAAHAGAQVIPYGGGTSVVGHINPLPGDSPTLTIDMSRMNRLLRFDEKSLLATFGAGVCGPDLEAQARARGCTLGHFPQSFEYSTLGGWVATRSSGQQSLRYGRIERLFAGGDLSTPAGFVDIPPFPASAAGPDLRELVLGSEGRLGVITSATVRLSRLPEREEFHAVFFPSFDHGQEAVRQMLQTGLSLAMLRLSTAKETTTTLALAGHETLIGGLEKLLSLRGLGPGKCMLIIGFSGSEAMLNAVRKEALNITGKHGGIHVGRTFGSQWNKNRFYTPYLRNTLWSRGYAVDTLETATDWSNVPVILGAVETALGNALSELGERVHIFTHLSHLYSYGSSIYTTYLFRLAPKPEESLHRWQLLKRAGSQAIVEHGGTISHQHGVGLDHRLYLPAEKGGLGIRALRQAMQVFDPQGIMNPGKLL